MAQIPLGGGVISDMGFYSSLHQESLEEKYKHDTCEQVGKFSYETLGGDNQGSVVHADISNLHKEEATNTVSEDSVKDTCKMIDYVAENLKRRLQQSPPDEQLFTGTKKLSSASLRIHPTRAMPC